MSSRSRERIPNDFMDADLADDPDGWHNLCGKLFRPSTNLDIEESADPLSVDVDKAIR
ncbi:hypothetical protein E4U13_006380, partial [Claviceps humidiphila]